MQQGLGNNAYHRPNQDWTCTAEPGCRCPSGPSPKGRCVSSSQCQPTLEGDHWRCNRAANRGGECEKGPDPFGKCCYENIGCVPAKSLRSKRKIFVVTFVSLITGILLVGIWGPNRNEFLAPGGLSSHHAQIWSGPNAEDRCVACHDAGNSGPLGWLTSVVSGKSHAGQPQYQKCLNCHKQSLSPAHALYVHNLPPDRLRQITAKKTADPNYNSHGSSGLFGSPANQNGELACANCHQEHHGKNHDLTAMTDKQCQSCHAGQFESFEQGHPEFKSFAQTYPTGIQFDHFRHQSKYFTEANKSFDCQGCHTGDEQNNVMQVASFETACASCHQKSIDASFTQGMPVFSLPSLDVEWLRQKGLDIGQWPESASGSFDGTIPPVMKVLLAGDPRAAKAIKLFGPEFDLFDIDMDDTEQLAAVQQLAISIKSLLYDLSSRGQAELIDRLDSLTKSQLATSRLQRMVSGLSSETFAVAQKKWFPDLEQERDRLKIPAAPAASASAIDFDTKHFVTQASFLQEDEDLLVENPLRKLYQPESKSPNDTQPDTQEKPADNATLNDPIQFEDLPQTITNPSPIESSSNNKSGFQANRPNAVENKFYYPRTQQELSDGASSNQKSDQQKSDIAFESPKNKPEKILNSYVSPKQDPLPKPEVIRDDSFGKIPEQEKLADNPLAKMLAEKENEKPNVTDPWKNEPPKGDVQVQKNKLVENDSPPKQDNKDTDPTTPKASPDSLLTRKKSGDKDAQTRARKLDINRLPPDKRVPLGGWYVDDETLTVAYRQTGHADDLTRNWYDFVVTIREPALDHALSDLRNIAQTTTSPGLCASCHRQVENEDHQHSIQWKSINRRASERGFTRFSHRPHLVQAGENQCSSCHVLDSETNQLPTTASESRSLECVSEFLPMTKSNCVSCHNQQSRIQNCTQCHNYHVDDSSTALPLPFTLTSGKDILQAMSQE